MLKYEYENLLADFRNLIDDVLAQQNRKYNWFNINGATEYCNCSKATIYRAIRDDRLMVTKPIGMNKLMFRRDWLDRWLNGKTI